MAVPCQLGASQAGSHTCLAFHAYGRCIVWGYLAGSCCHQIVRTADLPGSRKSRRAAALPALPGSLLVLLLLLVLMYDVQVVPVWPARWLSHSLNANMAAFCWRLQHLVPVLSTKGVRLLQRLPISRQQGLRDMDGEHVRRIWRSRSNPLSVGLLLASQDNHRVRQTSDRHPAITAICRCGSAVLISFEGDQASRKAASKCQQSSCEVKL